MSDIGLIVREWQARFEGQLLTSRDGSYETSGRIWNGMIDRRPSLIVRCACGKDVGLAIKLARAEQMQVSVRGGGHGVAGTAVSDGGLMIDLSLLKEIRVDRAAREATAAPVSFGGNLIVPQRPTAWRPQADRYPTQGSLV